VHRTQQAVSGGWMAVNGGCKFTYIWSVEDIYTTVAQNATAIYKDRGSKFIGYVFAVNSVTQTQECFKAVKEEHPSATHHCFAWRLGQQGDQFRAYDDGEPSGTAGRPIYDGLRSAGLTNTMVVVVRYYGGTQLGKPGLIQAYKETTMLVLKAGGSIQKAITTLVDCQFPYVWMNEVMTELKKAGAMVVQMDASELVKVRFEIRSTLIPKLKTTLQDRTQEHIQFEL